MTITPAAERSETFNIKGMSFHAENFFTRAPQKRKTEMDQTLSKTNGHTNRRDLLKGSAFTGALLMASASRPALAQSSKKTPTVPSANHPHSDKVVKAAGAHASKADPVDLSHLPRVKQETVRPPAVPNHDQIAKTGPKIVEVRFEIEEKRMTVEEDTGATIWAMTFNGSVPGPLIVLHEGDYLELTLVNPETNLFEHNIDFHASTGALGGGGLTHVNLGEETILRWKAIKPGVFVYHCAPGGVMIPYHVCHGMNGAVMVLPRDGLKDREGNQLTYDQAVFVGEQDYYLPRDENGDYIQYEAAGDDMPDYIDSMRTLTPTHCVFNGSVGALTGDNAIQSEVGKTVLIVHAQCNRDTRPHLIGGHGEYVWETGSFSDAPATGFETWFIRGGSAGAAMYTFKQPGIYAYLNHNLVEAVLLGALAHFKVEGEWDDDLMSQVAAPRPISG